jgi:predicted nucleic acid-binding protein
MGPAIEAAFLVGLAGLAVIGPAGADWRRIADLVRLYADMPLGGTDAAVIALAERARTDTIITLDRRHFTVVRPRHLAAWRLLPDVV